MYTSEKARVVRGSLVGYEIYKGQNPIVGWWVPGSSVITFYYPKIGVQSDDIVLNSRALDQMCFFTQDVVITEKMDGGNCSLYRGKVSLLLGWVLS